MKLGIIVDSSCGLTKKEANNKKWGYLPLYMTIDDKEYTDGVDITSAEYYKLINSKMNVKTSATPPGIIEEELNKMSKEFDQVIVYSLSKELSSQNNNIKIIANKFDNIYVINSLAVGYGIVENCKLMENSAKNNSSIENIIKKAEEINKNYSGFVIPETMEWLVKGGRATAGAAAMANMLKIVPIIAFENGKLEKGGKGRVFKKTLIKASVSHIKNQNKNTRFVMLNAGNDHAKELIKLIKEKIDVDIKLKPFPPIIGNHVGKGAIAILSYTI